MEDALAGLEGRTWSKALREYEQKLANWCDAGTSEMQPSVRKHYAAAPAKLRTRYLELQLDGAKLGRALLVRRSEPAPRIS